MATQVITQYGNSGKMFTKDTLGRKMGYKGVTEWGEEPVPLALWFSGTLRKISLLYHQLSVSTDCWMETSWEVAGEGWKSTQIVMPDLTPFQACLLEISLGVRHAEGKPGETERGWHEVNFSSVKLLQNLCNISRGPNTQSLWETPQLSSYVHLQKP